MSQFSISSMSTSVNTLVSPSESPITDPESVEYFTPTSPQAKEFIYEDDSMFAEYDFTDPAFLKASEEYSDPKYHSFGDDSSGYQRFNFVCMPMDKSKFCWLILEIGKMFQTKGYHVDTCLAIASFRPQKTHFTARVNCNRGKHTKFEKVDHSVRCSYTLTLSKYECYVEFSEVPINDILKLFENCNELLACWPTDM